MVSYKVITRSLDLVGTMLGPTELYGSTHLLMLLQPVNWNWYLFCFYTPSSMLPLICLVWHHSLKVIPLVITLVFVKVFQEIFSKDQVLQFFPHNWLKLYLLLLSPLLAVVVFWPLKDFLLLHPAQGLHTAMFGYCVRWQHWDETSSGSILLCSCTFVK